MLKTGGKIKFRSISKEENIKYAIQYPVIPHNKKERKKMSEEKQI